MTTRHRNMHRPLLLFLLLAAAYQTLHAQQAPALDPNVHGCRDAQLEVTLHAFLAPGNTRVLAFNYRNLGDVPCRLREFRKQNGYPVVTVVPGPLNSAGVPIYPHEIRPLHTTLAPGETAHSSFRYSTEPIPGGPPCRREQPLFSVITGTDDGSINLASRTLAPAPCSPIADDTDYHPGPFIPDWPASNAPAPAQPSPPELTAAKQSYFEHERLLLHTTLTDRTASDPSCPVLLETSRDARGHLTIDEVVNPQHPEWDDNPQMAKFLAGNPYFYCHNSSPWTKPYNEFDIPVLLGNGASLRGLGPHTFGIIQLTAPAPSGELLQAASPTVTVDVRSAVDIPRTWGKPAAGVRIDLTLDKADYAVGENIPLHIATEDLAAAGTVFDAPPTSGLGVQWPFPPSLTFLVEGEHGPITPRQLMIFGGPVACPELYPKGTVVPHELQLAEAGYDLTEPGAYRITALWKPYTSPSGKCESRQLLIQENGRLEENKTPSTPLEPFTTVASAPVTIHIH